MIDWQLGLLRYAHMIANEATTLLHVTREREALGRQPPRDFQRAKVFDLFANGSCVRGLYALGVLNSKMYSLIRVGIEDTNVGRKSFRRRWWVGI